MATDLLLDNSIDYSKSYEEAKCDIQNAQINARQWDQRKYCPFPYEMVYLAKLAYSDPIKIDDLPSDWKFLMSAGNNSFNNGYFGSAFYNKNHQQIVIAHRGTTLHDTSDLLTDINGIMKNTFTQQQTSAMTFAHLMVQLINELNENEDSYWKLSFTGHSLGGWLAQITAFSVKYLEVTDLDGKTKCFTPFKLDEGKVKGYHAHTVAIDSPGCEPILTKMADKHPRYSDISPISLRELDITNYLSAINIVNTQNEHVGTVYELQIQVGRVLNFLEWISTKVYFYSNVFETHGIDKLLGCFDKNTGYIKKDENDSFKMYHIIDWPSSTDEAEKSLKNADQNKNSTIRYIKENYKPEILKINTFTQLELNLFKKYELICDVKNYTLVVMPQYPQVDELFKRFDRLIEAINLKNGTIICKGVEELEELLNGVKNAFHFKSNLRKAAEELSYEFGHIPYNLYKYESEKYSDIYEKQHIYVDKDLLELSNFLKADHQLFVHTDRTPSVGMFKCVKVFQFLQDMNSINSSGPNEYLKNHLFLSLKTILLIKQQSEFANLVKVITTKFLIVIVVDLPLQLNASAVETLKDTIAAVEISTKIKLVIVTDSGNRDMVLVALSNKPHSNSNHIGISVTDLSQQSIESLCEKPFITLQGIPITINLICDSPVVIKKELMSIFSDEILMGISDSMTVEVGQTLAGLGGMDKYYINRSIVDNDTQDVYKEDSENVTGECKHIEDISNRLVVVSGSLGMGKTSFFKHLANRKKILDSSSWIIEVNLIQLSDQLKRLQAKNDKNGEYIIEFLMSLAGLSKGTSKVKEDLFHFYLNCGKLTLLLDGFDEICPNYADILVDFTETLLRKTKIKQIWLNSEHYAIERYFPKENLKIYHLAGFDRAEKERFLENYWAAMLNQSDPDMYAVFKTLILNKLREKIVSDSEELTSKPSILKLLAKYFEYFLNLNSEFDIALELVNLNVARFYSFIVDRKFLSSFIKSGINLSVAENVEIKDREITNMYREHKLLALRVLLSAEDVASILNDDEQYDLEKLEKKVNQKVFLNTNNYGQIKFIHRTFAEYFATLWFTDKMRKQKDFGKLMEILVKLMINSDSAVVYGVIDSEMDVQISKLFLQFVTDKEMCDELRYQASNYLCENVSFCLEINQRYLNNTSSSYDVFYQNEFKCLHNKIVERVGSDIRQLLEDPNSGLPYQEFLEKMANKSIEEICKSLIDGTT
ncbi:hypothetical protein CHUAL_004631 [Chamberlinius hualienensis]